MNADGQTIEQAIREDLANSIFELAKLRETVAAAKEQLDRMYKQLQESAEWIQYQGILTSSKKQLDETEQHIRDLAELNCTTTGDKHPHPAINLRMKTSLHYEQALALAWCTRHLQSAIKLDARLFEQHARAVTGTAPLRFVDIKQEPQATIASDLRAYLTGD